MQTMIDVIGGSGVYQIDGLEGASWVKVKTPWGKPSDEVLLGRLDGVAMAFLPRHGRGHVLGPTSVPYRANLDALKRLGCTDVIAVSAVGQGYRVWKSMGETREHTGNKRRASSCSIPESHVEKLQRDHPDPNAIPLGRGVVAR